MVAQTLPMVLDPAERFDGLFTRFYPELFGLTYRVLGERMATEDTLQETFLKLSRDVRLLSRPDGEVGAWLRRVALNDAFNRLRSDRRHRAQLEHLERGQPSEAGPVELLVRREDQAEVRRALAELPERQRACLLLRHSGYSYAEIAATVGIAIGSVGVLLARAEAAFRLTYRRHTPDDLS